MLELLAEEAPAPGARPAAAAPAAHDQAWAAVRTLAQLTEAGAEPLTGGPKLVRAAAHARAQVHPVGLLYWSAKVFVSFAVCTLLCWQA